MTHGQGTCEILEKNGIFLTHTAAGSNLYESLAPLNIFVINVETKWESQKIEHSSKLDDFLA